MSDSMKHLSHSARISRISAVIGLATLIGYCVYGAMYQYFDTVVFIAIAIGVISGEGYARFDTNIGELLNLLAAAGYAFGIGLFFLNSYPVWADRLNNIQMYGARGSLTPVIVIMALLLICIIAEIISCFTRKEVMK